MIFDELKGILFVKNIELPDSYIQYVSFRESMQNYVCIDKRLHKFHKDEVMYQKDGVHLFLDGYVENKQEICDKTCESEWVNALFKEISVDGVSTLRGGFCGIYDTGSVCRLFVDQVGNRALYYYVNGDKLIISTRLFFITELMKALGIHPEVDEQAVRYMLTLGFMADDSTICSAIKRVCPGDYVDIFANGQVEIIKYFKPDNTHIDESISIDDAVEGVDHYFRQAVGREYEKDREYGYRHLVDLSGGLDSRMTAWVAHDMGYTDQINISYCHKNYMDFDIAQDISCDLKHRFVFMPLDDFKWFEDVDINTIELNAASLYAGATGARSILEIVKGCDCGIEHTGMVGDAIISTFYNDREYNYSRPNGNENAYSEFLKYQVPQSVLDAYKNREEFSIYTRGLLGAQSSYMLRQNYFETASPFLDMDFLTFILSLPFEFRAQHRIYLMWIRQKYPEAAGYGWEKWHGAKPTEKARIFQKKALQLNYLVKNRLSFILPSKVDEGMTPMEYWFTNNRESQRFAK